jgi:hypothetical protein
MFLTSDSLTVCETITFSFVRNLNAYLDLKFVKIESRFTKNFIIFDG